MVKRWQPTSDGGMEEIPEPRVFDIGEYVLASEYDALAAELATSYSQTRYLMKDQAAKFERIKALEAALDSISEIGVSQRLDICQSMLKGVMACAKEALKPTASEPDGAQP